MYKMGSNQLYIHIDGISIVTCHSTVGDTNAMLYFQHEHRFYCYLEGDNHGQIRVVYHYYMKLQTLDEHVGHYVTEPDRYGSSSLGPMTTDHVLVTSSRILEQKTRMFHLLVGEASMALHDVAIILGLRIDLLSLHMETSFTI